MVTSFSVTDPWTLCPSTAYRLSYSPRRSSRWSRRANRWPRCGHAARPGTGHCWPCRTSAPANRITWSSAGVHTQVCWVRTHCIFFFKHNNVLAARRITADRSQKSRRLVFISFIWAIILRYLFLSDTYLKFNQKNFYTSAQQRECATRDKTNKRSVQLSDNAVVRQTISQRIHTKINTSTRVIDNEENILLLAQKLNQRMTLNAVFRIKLLPWPALIVIAQLT